MEETKSKDPSSINVGMDKLNGVITEVVGSSSCVTTHCSSTAIHTPSQFHCIPLNGQSYIPEAA